MPGTSGCCDKATAARPAAPLIAASTMPRSYSFTCSTSAFADRGSSGTGSGDRPSASTRAGISTMSSGSRKPMLASLRVLTITSRAPRPCLALAAVALHVGPHVRVPAHAHQQVIRRPGGLHAAVGECPGETGEQFGVQAQHVLPSAEAGPGDAVEVAPGVIEVVHVLGG